MRNVFVGVLIEHRNVRSYLYQGIHAQEENMSALNIAGICVKNSGSIWRKMRSQAAPEVKFSTSLKIESADVEARCQLKSDSSADLGR